MRAETGVSGSPPPSPDVVASVLADVAAFGRDNDAHQTERARRMLNITPETGQLLRILVQATAARRILEVGTSNGYSTLWLAWSAAETDGHVDTIELAADKVDMARANLARAGLAERVTLHHGPAATLLAQLPGPYDLIFLDADRPSYLTYLDLVLPRLAPGGLLVTDNVVSHAGELQAYLERVRTHPLLESVTLPIGNGEELSLKRRAPSPAGAAAERLRALPVAVESVLATADDAALRARPAAGEWSAIEVLGHLVDKMQVWRERVERLAREERPFLPGYDQDALVRERGYQSASRDELLADLRAACERFAQVVEALPVTALRHEGIHGETGPITLEECIRAPVDSAAEHLGQMRAALEASGGSPSTA